MKLQIFNNTRWLSMLFFFPMFFACNQKQYEIPDSDELLISSETQIVEYVNSVYEILSRIYGPCLSGAEKPQHPFWLLPADDLTFDGSGHPIENFYRLGGDNEHLEAIWKNLYRTVNLSNLILKKLEDPLVANLVSNVENLGYYKGQLLFLRSWAYYKIWDWWREAPLQDNKPSSGFQMLDESILSLEKAASLLPIKWDNHNIGRVNRDAAYGLLVKCYVLRACYNNRDQDDYLKAISAFEKISNERQLVVFGHNFDYRFENNAESLFEYQADFDQQSCVTLGPSLDHGAFYQYQNTHWWNNVGNIGPTLKLINAMEDGDPRKEETISKYPDNLQGMLWFIQPWHKFNGYQLVKYTNGLRGNRYDPIQQISSANNTRLLRLSDVKLAVAEAYLAVGKTNDALTQVNAVRTRARNSTSDGLPTVVPANLEMVTMQDIMDERFVELVGEDGHRWTDLRRWHAAGYIDLASWSASEFGASTEYPVTLFQFNVAKHLVFPFPNSELLNNPELAKHVQNSN